MKNDWTCLINLAERQTSIIKKEVENKIKKKDELLHEGDRCPSIFTLAVIVSGELRNLNRCFFYCA